ncbi:MAG TPA: glutamate-1-semialdehyde 2,1-aminomutase [Candidatus Micrarchaeia archaeon]|nr:glutamate-1-semialdehyde 2,1-aminomutase [Candidatus Micrarchaeia archaeon]
MAVATRTDTHRSQAMFRRIATSVAGGESSYARLRAGIELCIDRTAGARMWDVDGNEYLDYCLGYGPLLFGHHPEDIVAAVVEQITTRGFHFSFPHRLDYEVGERLQRMVPSMELMRFACSGTEATMAAMRLARGFTGKEKIVKFEGAYHGWSDGHYISAHPPLGAAGLHRAPFSLPDTAGIPRALADTLIIQPFNDLELLERTLSQRSFEIAAVLMEPVLANCGIIPPLAGFLEGVRRLTEAHGVLLVFDEVMTGFRVAPGGAQERYRVRPDLSTFAKVLGGGFPVAAFGGRADVMELEATGAVMHGGTYSASPLVLAAAKAVLDRIERDRGTMYARLEALTERLQSGLLRVVRAAGYPSLVQGVGPFFQLFFLDQPRERLVDYRDAMGHVRPEVYEAFHEAMQHRGIYFHPGQSERWFLSTEHTEEDVDLTIAAAAEAIEEVSRRLPPTSAAA